MSDEQLPPFAATGYLPPGDYWPTRTDFEGRFVAVPSSSSRTNIYAGFIKHREALLREGVAGDAPCILNGSYTTEKVDPGDIDIAVEIDFNRYQSSPSLQGLVAGKKTRAAYLCDAYPILVLPEGHPWFDSVTKKGREYWTRWFGKDRADVPKGRVWANTAGFR